MYAFEAQSIRKTYGGVTALANGAIAIRPGTVHALLGENGAGKSTLVKVMTGVVSPDSGTLRLEGNVVSFDSTADAAKSGVAVVSQELSLFPHLSVVANMFPMREPKVGLFISKRKMFAQALPIMRELGLNVSPNTLVQDLSLAERQLVEIAKALVQNPRVLLLDEPTSALEASSSERLIGILRVLKDRNVAVVFITHILEEVMAVCDDVTVLRDGNVVIAGDQISDHTVASLVAAMIGERKVIVRDSTRTSKIAQFSDAGLLKVDSVSVGKNVTDLTFTAHPGEVLGLAGLAGSGPNEVLRALAGIDRVNSGTITFPGISKAPRGQRNHIKAGVAFVSGDRRRYGLMLEKPVWENIVQVRTMGLGKDGILLSKKPLFERAAELVAKLRIKVSSPNAAAGSMSGGNQQKVVLAKWLDINPSTILLDDPTRGVDVVARSEIHQLLRESADAGAAVVMCSTDLEELASACDRVLVFYRGQVCATLSGESNNSSNMLQLMNSGVAA